LCHPGNGTSPADFLANGEAITAAYTANVDYKNATIELAGVFSFEVAGTKAVLLDKLEAEFNNIDVAEVELDKSTENINITFVGDVYVSDVEAVADQLLTAIRLFIDSSTSTLNVGSKEFKLETVTANQLASAIIGEKDPSALIIAGDSIVVSYVASVDYKNAIINLNGYVSLTITKASYDMTNVSFEDASYTYDGNEKELLISGTLPVGVEVTYTENKLTDAGSLEVTAIFTGSPNYEDISSLTATLTINPLEVTVTPKAGQSKVYGDDDPVLTYTHTDLIGEDKLTGALGREAGEDVGFYAITQGDLAVPSGNYTLSFVDGVTFEITKAVYNMTNVSFEDASYTYDGNEKELLISGTLPVGVEVSYTANKLTDAGSLEVTASFTGSPNYEDISSLTATLTINPLEITVTADGNQSKVYGETDPVLTYTNTTLIGEDKLTGALGREAGEDVGFYAITQGDLAVPSGNYTLSFVDGVTFEITKAVYNMTNVSFEDASYTYDGNEKELLISGTLPVGVEVSYTANKLTDAGSLEVTASFTGSPNYEDISSLTATLTINPLEVTVTPKAGQSKVYGDDDPVLTYTHTDLIGEDKLTGALGREAGEDVGTYAITIGDLAVPSGNYTLSFVDGVTFEITKAVYNMTNVSFEDASYTYDGNEKELLISGTLPVGVEVSYTANKLTDAGSLEVTASFTGSPNYEDISSLTATLTINPLEITVTADGNQSKVYGETDPVLTYTNTTLIGEDKLTGALGREAGEDVGFYAITQGDLAVPSGNYTLSFVDGVTFEITKAVYNMTNVSFEDASYTYDGNEKELLISGTLPVGVEVSYTANKLTDAGSLEVTASFTGSPNYEDISSLTATLTINPLEVTVTPKAGQSKVYGDDDPVLTYTHTDLIGEDKLTGALGREAGEDVGTYAITIGDLAVPSGNYTLSFVDGVTFEITKAVYNMTNVSFEDASYTYDGNEKELLISGTLPVGVEVSYTANKLTDAGSLEVTASFTGSPNYEDISSLTATLTINPLEITITPEAGQSKVYGDDDPVLTYTHTDLIGEDKLTGALGREAGEDVGTYAITQGDLALPNANYTLSFVDGATFEITKATYDMSNISFGNASYTYDGSERVLEISGDLPEGVGVSYTANKLTDAGSLEVTASFTGSPNYENISSLTATLTINPLEITITPEAGQSKVYGDDDPVLTYTHTDLIGEDKLTGALGREAGEDVGIYAITQGDLAVPSGNYTLSFVDGVTFEITKATYDMSNVSFGNASYTYDGSERELLISGTLPAGVEVSYTANKLTDAGSLEVTASFMGSPNYEDIPDLTATLTINPLEITVTPDAGQSKVYGDTDPTFTYTHTALIGEDKLTGALGREAGEDVGLYAITQGDLAVPSGNYTLSFVDGVTFEITKATYDMSNVSFGNASYTYDGSERELLISGTLPAGVEVSYTANKLTDAGSLEVTASFMGSPNYEDISSLTATLTINPLEVTVTPKAGQSKVYGDDDPVFTYTHTALVGDDELTGALSRVDGSDVGIYAITQGDLAVPSGNYTLSFVDGVTFEITKATYDMSNISFGNASYTYDGSERVLEISGDLPEGVGVSYTANKLTDAGSLEVTASFTGSPNYENISSLTATLTINPLEVTITPEAGQSKVYGDDDPVLTYTHTDLIGEDKLTGALGREAGEDVGTYAITQGDLALPNANYTLSFVDGATFEITKATYDMSNISFGNASYTYDGNEKELLISGTLPAGVEVSYTANKLTDAGSLEVTASFMGSPNYEDISSLTAILTINPLEITITPKAGQSKVYGDDDPIFTYTHTALVGDDELTGATHMMEVKEY
jgi:archaellin